MSSLHNIDIYDFAAWIDLAPDFDWDNLHPAPPEEDPEEDPEEPESGE